VDVRLRRRTRGLRHRTGRGSGDPLATRLASSAASA
jgi:hypothetical protein